MRLGFEENALLGFGDGILFQNRQFLFLSAGVIQVGGQLLRRIMFKQVGKIQGCLKFAAELHRQAHHQQ